jgi:hypothetical protein
MSLDPQVSPHIQYKNDALGRKKEQLEVKWAAKQARIAKFSACRVFPGLRNGKANVRRVRKKHVAVSDPLFDPLAATALQRGAKAKRHTARIEKQEDSKVYERNEEHVQSLMMCPRLQLRQINEAKRKQKPFATSNTSAAKEDMYKTVVGGMARLPYGEHVEIERARERERKSKRISAHAFVAGSVRGVKDLIAVDYYLNSPDEAVKRAEAQLIKERSLLARQQFSHFNGSV